MEIVLAFAVGALLVACGGLAFYGFMMESRIKDLEEWREDVEGDYKLADNLTPSSAAPHQGHEDWRNQVL